MRSGTGRWTTPYDRAMDGMTSRCNDGSPSDGPATGTANVPASAAPIVPDDSAKAVDEFRPSAN